MSAYSKDSVLKEIIPSNLWWTTSMVFRIPFRSQASIAVWAATARSLRTTMTVPPQNHHPGAGNDPMEAERKDKCEGRVRGLAWSSAFTTAARSRMSLGAVGVRRLGVSPSSLR